MTTLSFAEAQRRFVAQAQEIIKHSQNMQWYELPPPSTQFVDPPYARPVFDPEAGLSVPDTDTYLDVYGEPVVLVAHNNKEKSFVNEVTATSEVQWQDSVRAISEGSHIVYYGARRGTSSWYPAYLYRKCKDHRYLFEDMTWVTLPCENAEGAFSSKFYHNYRNLHLKDSIQHLVERSSEHHRRELYHNFSFVVDSDPINDYLLVSCPTVLPRSSHLDCVADFQLLPEKVLILDVEAETKFGKEVWTGAFVTMDRGKFKEAQQWYFSDVAYHKYVNDGLPASYICTSDYFRHLIQKYYCEGYIICAKGAVLEFNFLLDRATGHTVRSYGEVNKYFIFDRTKELHCHYKSFGIFDLVMEKYDKIRLSYANTLPYWVQEKAVMHQHLMKHKIKDHVPLQECAVFLAHWRQMQDDLFFSEHWDDWQEYYKNENDVDVYGVYQNDLARGRTMAFRGRKYAVNSEPEKERLVIEYWDERAQWCHQRSDGVRKKRIYEQVEFFSSLGGGVAPLWHVMDAICDTLKREELQLQYAIAFEKKISVKDAVLWQQIKEYEVHSLEKASVNRTMFFANSSLMFKKYILQFEEFNRKLSGKEVGNKQVRLQKKMQEFAAEHPHDEE